MYINKLIKKQVMLILATVVLVGTLAVTTSFAVFEETKSNATDQKMTIGNLDVTYTGGSAISITDINPMTDSTALSKTNNIYTFTIKNTGTVPYNFKVKVINNPSYTSNLLPHQYIRYSLNGGTASALGTGQDDYELTSGVIEAGATNTYNLRLWVADASTYSLPNSALGQEIHLKISVEGKAGSGWLPSNFKDRILALNEVKAPITTPGAAVSTASEALLASTEDDYGTSYYFRGEVKNNYVEFANKCWRIVRIGGDNTIKLILHNDNTSNTSNPCSSANSHTTAAFAHYNGDTYTSVFNSNYDDNAYVGFMYGTVDSSTYEATHANINKSTILTNLEIWYNDNLKTCESVIDDNVFCNDKSNVTDTSYDPMNAFNTSQITGLGYRTAGTYYAAYKRLYTNKTPSLKCNGTLSKITSKIGLITADELVYAGNVVVTSGSTSYLQENATGSHWWSMTPSDYYVDSMLPSPATEAQVLLIKDNCSVDRYKVNISNAVRPVISLIPSTAISGGSGTSEDPYVVN